MPPDAGRISRQQGLSQSRCACRLVALLRRKFLKFVVAKLFEVFASFFEVFARCSRFSGAFAPIWIHSDLLGRIRMHLDAFGSVWTLSEKLGFFGIVELLFAGFGRFSDGMVFGLSRTVANSFGSFLERFRSFSKRFRLFSDRFQIVFRTVSDDSINS